MPKRGERVRAIWTDRTGAAAGAVVAVDQREAAVFALAELRRALAGAGLTQKE